MYGFFWKHGVLLNRLKIDLTFPINYIKQEAKEDYKSLKVDELTTQIILKYNLMSPDICLNCSTVYTVHNNDIGSSCFLCSKTMCGNCAPDNLEDSTVNKIQFFVVPN